MGVAEQNILVCEDGDQLVLGDHGITRGEKVPAGYLYVDGIVGDVGQGVLRDRRVLAEEGVVVVVVAVDVTTGAIITGPEVITRGWVYAPEAEALLDECAEEVRKAVRGSVRERRRWTSRRSSATSAGRPGGSWPSARAAAR